MNRYEKYKEYYKRKAKEQYANHKKLRIQQIKIWAEDNKEKQQKYSLTYYYKNQEKICLSKRKYICII